MKKRTSAISFGPGASSLILIFVVLTMTVLGILALLSARNDRNLSVQSVKVVEAQYQLHLEAEEQRAAIDRILTDCRQSSDTQAAYLEHVAEALPEGVSLDAESGVIAYEVSDGSRTIQCRLQLHGLDDPVRTTWIAHNLTAVTEDELWN